MIRLTVKTVPPPLESQRSLELDSNRHYQDQSIMELSNFSAKLEPFLLMAKSLKGAAAAKLIQDATSAPGVFVFSELLELPNIQEVPEIYPKAWIWL